MQFKKRSRIIFFCLSWIVFHGVNAEHNLLNTSSSVGNSKTELYYFQNSQQKKQFYELTGNLRCLVCQNESLLDSNAPLAIDLRQEIIRKIQLGDTNQEIKNYLLKRYGDFVLYQPRFNSQNLFLWLSPMILLLGALFFSIIKVYQASRTFSQEEMKGEAL